MDLLQSFNPNTFQKCNKWFTIRLVQEESGQEQHTNISRVLPILEDSVGGSWPEIVNRTFDPIQHPERTIPLFSASSSSNTTTMTLGLGFSNSDKDDPDHPLCNKGCLSSSSPKGVNTFVNFLEAKRQS